MKKAKGDFMFPFYVQRYWNGTMGFTVEMHGAYLLALIYQFNNGSFTTEEVNRVLDNKFDLIKHKFQKDENGKWFNDTMQDIIIERKSFIETKRNNRLGKTKQQRQLNCSSTTVALQGGCSGGIDISCILDLINTEIPEATGANQVTSPILFQRLDSFLQTYPTFSDIEIWKQYLEKIKQSDFLMGRGDEVKSVPLSVSWICDPKNAMEVMDGKYKNRIKRREKNAILI